MAACNNSREKVDSEQLCRLLYDQVISRYATALSLSCCITAQTETITQSAEDSTEAWIKEPFLPMHPCLG